MHVKETLKVFFFFFLEKSKFIMESIYDTSFFFSLKNMDVELIVKF